MLAFRFANGMFEPLWNRNYIDSVQITAAEDIGIGTRAGFYDQAGALRDLIQNHMLQLLCHVAMEPPVSFTAEEVRNEKVKVLHAIHAPTARADPRDRRARAVRRRALRRRGRARLPRRGRRARRARRPRPSPRCAWKSTTGAGPACPSTCAPASAWRARSPRSRSRSSPSPISPSPRTARSGCKPNQLVLTCSPTRASRCSSARRSPAAACGSAR